MWPFMEGLEYQVKKAGLCPMGCRELWKVSEQRHALWEQESFMVLLAYWFDCCHHGLPGGRPWSELMHNLIEFSNTALGG